MHKKLIVIPIVLVIVLSIGYLFLAPKQTTPQSMPEVMQNDAPKSEPKTTPQSSQSGKYIDYQEGVVAKTDGTKILFFHAPWCPQCRDLEADIKASKIPEGVTIIKVDYDSNAALKQKYGVTLQTTLVLVDDAGNGVKKFVAYDEPTLDALNENLLQ